MTLKEWCKQQPGRARMSTESRNAATLDVMRVLPGLVKPGLVNLSEYDRVLLILLQCAREHGYNVSWHWPPSGVVYDDSDAKASEAAQHRAVFQATWRFGKWLNSQQQEDWLDFVQTVLTHLVQLKLNKRFAESRSDESRSDESRSNLAGARPE